MNRILPAVVICTFVVACPCLAEYVVTAQVSNGYFTLSNPNSIDDFDGDGDLEIVTIRPGPPNHAMIYEAMTGELEADVPLPGGGDMLAMAAKLDQDPLPEIVVHPGFPWVTG